MIDAWKNAFAALAVVGCVAMLMGVIVWQQVVDARTFTAACAQYGGHQVENVSGCVFWSRHKIATSTSEIRMLAK